MNKIIWTNHAKQRANERKIDLLQVESAILSPDKTSPNEKGGVEYQKKVGNQTFIALAKENEDKEVVIISAWVNPPNPGTRDEVYKKRYKESQNASWFKKLWLTFLNQTGF
ncbi:MAG: hypothetical protein COU27_01710 [Candidatus Levybacteria bacterium CG10_big_fil_rev_8_21_14_0_10_36_7]|nr:MAG: hypothetical protein COU27_01710 [Candidatus Levybacteria bacterium CG10_big_fil_rev_8_21_14_0_10_36_7]